MSTNPDIESKENTVSDRWQAKVGAHEELLTASELLDRPDDAVLVGGIYARANALLQVRQGNQKG